MKKKICKTCKSDKNADKDFRKGSRRCKDCDKEAGKQKRAERWEFLGLDMSKTF
jgi:hypothetical protein